MVTNAGMWATTEVILKTMATDAAVSGATYVMSEMLADVGLPPAVAGVMTVIASGVVTYSAREVLFQGCNGMDVIIEHNTMILNGKKINLNNKIDKILEFPNYCIILLMDDNVPENNVEAYDYNGNIIWNISQIIKLKYSETYISLSRESETLFSVVSYNGVKFVVDINTLQILNKNITK